MDAAMEQTRFMGAYSDAQVAASRAEMRKKVMNENQGLAEQQFASNSYLDSRAQRETRTRV